MFIQYRPDKDVWAYGVEPAKVRYRLRLARYPALAEYLQAWLKQKPENRTFTLVDVGVGFGRTFLYVDAAGIGDRFEMIGIDIDPTRKNDVYASPLWNIRQGDAQERLQFADSSVDVVVSEQLLEHLDYPGNLITEVHRILKPGGLFICGVPIFPRPIAKIRRWLVRHYGLRGSEHVQTYTLHSIRGDLAEYFDEVACRGFRIVSGGLLRQLENYEWWYRFNRRLGEWLPGLCIEAQLIVVPKK